jgi:hypothetical protein
MQKICSTRLLPVLMEVMLLSSCVGMLSMQPVHAATATCWCETYLGSVRYGFSGIDLTQITNMSFSGLAPQQNARNQAACKQRCADVAAQFDKSVVANAMCQLQPDRTGVQVTARARLGVQELGETFPFGTFKSELKQAWKCPASWVSNSTNQPGPTSDGICKKETSYVMNPPIFPTPTANGTPESPWYGFWWNNTLVLYGNTANGGKALPDGPPTKLCGWQ